MRMKLIKKLAFKLREAENKYLKTGLDQDKYNVVDEIQNTDLSSEEENELYDLCDSMAC